MSPKPGWYSQTQIRATTVEGRSQGAKNATLKNHRAGMALLASSAKTRERSTRGGVLSRVKRIVCHSEIQKSGSPKSSL